VGKGVAVSARDDLTEYTNSSFTATGRVEIQRLLEAYRAEVLTEAAGEICREVRTPAMDYDASRWNRVVDLCIDAITP
jgi:hypothetical protein